MIRLYITDFSELADVPPSINVEQRTSASFAAYMSLEVLYEVCFRERMPKIKRTEHGKPYFDENPHCVHFSISHTETHAVALLTDEGECGVDIEEEVSSSRAATIERRFLSGIDFSLASFNTRPEIIAARLPSPLGARELCELTPRMPVTELDRVAYQRGERELCELWITNGLEPISRWTLLEAVLKADGRGFAAYKSVGEIIPSCTARHYVFTDNGKSFYISLAIKKKQV